MGASQRWRVENATTYMAQDEVAIPAAKDTPQVEGVLTRGDTSYKGALRYKLKRSWFAKVTMPSYDKLRVE